MDVCTDVFMDVCMDVGTYACMHTPYHSNTGSGHLPNVK